MARLLRNEPRFDYSPFLRGSRDASTKGRSARKEVQEAVNETDDCDTPWSTFVPIVQECRLFPLLLSLFSPSLSLSARSLHVSLFRVAVRIAKTRYSLDRYAPRLSLFLASRTPTLRSCGRERTEIYKSLESWPQYLSYLFSPFFVPIIFPFSRNFC